MYVCVGECMCVSISAYVCACVGVCVRVGECMYVCVDECQCMCGYRWQLLSLAVIIVGSYYRWQLLLAVIMHRVWPWHYYLTVIWESMVQIFRQYHHQKYIFVFTHHHHQKYIFVFTRHYHHSDLESGAGGTLSIGLQSD